MKPTILTNAPIVGWDCTPAGTIEGEQTYVCTPSDEYIRVRAYFRYVTQTPPGSDAFANWITAENDFIAAGGNDIEPLP